VIALAADGTPYEVVEGDAPTLNIPPTYTPVVVAAAVGEATATPAPAGTLPPGTQQVLLPLVQTNVQSASPLGTVVLPIVLVAGVSAAVGAAVVMARRTRKP
jgi:hypothetical protein